MNFIDKLKTICYCSFFVQIKKLARKQESSGDKSLPKASNTDSDSECLSCKFILNYEFEYCLLNDKMLRSTYLVYGPGA